MDKRDIGIVLLIMALSFIFGWSVYLSFGCGPSINQTVRIDPLSYDFHVYTKIGDGEYYDRALLNIKWIDIDLAIELEKIRAEQYLRMMEDYKDEVRYLRKLPNEFQ